MQFPTLPAVAVAVLSLVRFQQPLGGRGLGVILHVRILVVHLGHHLCN